MWQISLYNLLQEARRKAAHKRQDVVDARRNPSLAVGGIVASVSTTYLGRLTAAKAFLETAITFPPEETEQKGWKVPSDRKLVRMIGNRHEKRNAVVIRTRKRQDARDDALIRRYEYLVSHHEFTIKQRAADAKRKKERKERRAKREKARMAATASGNDPSNFDDDHVSDNEDTDDTDDDSDEPDEEREACHRAKMVATKRHNQQLNKLRKVIGESDYHSRLRALHPLNIYQTVLFNHLRYPVQGVTTDPTIEDEDPDADDMAKRARQAQLQAAWAEDPHAPMHTFPK